MTQRCLPEPDSLHILCVCYGGGHVQAILPAAKALQASGVRVCIFALTTAIKPVAESGIPYFTYADLPQAKDSPAKDHGVRLAASLEAPSALPLEETQAYLGVNYADLESSLGPEQAEVNWNNFGRKQFLPQQTMKDVLKHIRPKLVLATNSPRSEKAAILAATDLGIPAITLVDLFALHAVKWLSRPDFGTHLYVLDESVKKFFVENGRPAEHITVTGNPAFDSIFDPQTRIAGQELRRARGWEKSHRPVVLYASTPHSKLHPFTGKSADPTLPRRLEDHLRKRVNGTFPFELVIRRHPSEDQSITEDAFVHASPRSDKVNELVHAVDAVIVTFSTVGLQAWLAGTPTIAMQDSIYVKDVPLADFGMALPADTIEDIIPVLKHIFSNKKRQVAKRRQLENASATQAILKDVLERLKVLQKL